MDKKKVRLAFLALVFIQLAVFYGIYVIKSGRLL
jgi:hypothetical protein